MRHTKIKIIIFYLKTTLINQVLNKTLYWIPEFLSKSEVFKKFRTKLIQQKILKIRLILLILLIRGRISVLINSLHLILTLCILSNKLRKILNLLRIRLSSKLMKLLIEERSWVLTIFNINKTLRTYMWSLFNKFKDQEK